MFKAHRMQLLAAALLVVGLAAPQANAQYVQWNYNNQAIALGSGCSSIQFDTAFVAAGDEISVIFSRLGVSIASASDPGSAVSNCRVRIPIRVNKQVAIGELTQTLSYGWAKDDGSEGDITTKATFFGLPANSINIHLPSWTRGADAFSQKSVTNNFFQFANWCRGSDVTGLMMIDFAVSAVRYRSSSTVSVSIFGEDIKYEALALWRFCV